jgi:hypothetical protein
MSKFRRYFHPPPKAPDRLFPDIPTCKMDPCPHCGSDRVFKMMKPDDSGEWFGGCLSCQKAWELKS